MNEMAGVIAGVAGGAGLLGVSASGIVDLIGKGLLGRRGLAMRGFGAIDRVIAHAGPVLRAALGGDYRETIAEAYRDGRGRGRAPDLLKEAVGAGLDRLSEAGEDVLRDTARSLGLPVETGDERVKAQARTALEAEIESAFSGAEAEYRATAKLAAGAVAIFLSLGIWFTLPGEVRADIPLHQALAAGLVAVPIAPMAKDIAKAIERLRAVHGSSG